MNVRLGSGMTLSQNDSRSNILAKGGVWNRKSDCFQNRRMLFENFIYFQRRDLFTASIDPLRQPAGEKKIAVCIEIPLVSRFQPAICEILSAAIGLRTLGIRGNDTGTPNSNLSDFPTRYGPATGIDYGNFPMPQGYNIGIKVSR